MSCLDTRKCIPCSMFGTLNRAQFVENGHVFEVLKPHVAFHRAPLAILGHIAADGVVLITCMYHKNLNHM